MSAMMIDVDIVVILRNDKLWTGDTYIDSIKKVTGYYNSLSPADKDNKKNDDDKTMDSRLK